MLGLVLARMLWLSIHRLIGEFLGKLLFQVTFKQQSLFILYASSCCALSVSLQSSPFNKNIHPASQPRTLWSFMSTALKFPFGRARQCSVSHDTGSTLILSERPLIAPRHQVLYSQASWGWCSGPLCWGRVGRYVCICLCESVHANSGMHIHMFVCAQVRGPLFFPGDIF